MCTAQKNIKTRKAEYHKAPKHILCITGIEPNGNKVLQPAVFTVETLEAGSGEVLVYVEDPEGHKEEASYS